MNVQLNRDEQARARMVYHGYVIDDPRLERMLSIAAELAERQAAGVREEQVRQTALIFSAAGADAA